MCKMNLLLLTLLIWSYIEHINSQLEDNNILVPNHKSTTEKSVKIEDNKIEHVLTEKDRPTWFKEAIKDIAYALRSYKFNIYDVRYQRDRNSAPRTGFMFFPKPPLRSLHWEAHHFCDESFLQCVDFLRKKIKQMALKRQDDSSVVIVEQKWDRAKNSKQIGQIELECKRMRDVDSKYAPPFEGPLERYQWLTTASYYMCWYTMNEVPDLEHLGDRCDNFAYCLDMNLGPTNSDPRADDSIPFGCATYSFCPDPCCQARHLTDLNSCWDREDLNPCFSENSAGKRQCGFKRKENTDFARIILNHWNVTCSCSNSGFVWSSRYGICVDVNECAITDKPVCQAVGTACANLPGSFRKREIEASGKKENCGSGITRVIFYRCICDWGYLFDPKVKECVESPVIKKIKAGRSAEKPKDEKPVNFKTFMHAVLKLFAKSNGGEILPVKFIFSLTILVFSI